MFLFLFRFAVEFKKEQGPLVDGNDVPFVNSQIRQQTNGQMDEWTNGQMDGAYRRLRIYI